MSELFEAMSDLANHPVDANPVARLSSRDAAEVVFDRIAREPRYQHFVRIPKRIVSCLDYFEVVADRSAAERALRRYYLFIGVVDQAIDSGDHRIATMVFDRLKSPVIDHSVVSDVAFMTETLKRQLDHHTRPMIECKLRDLYATVVDERYASSIESYIESRKQIGRLTAEISYLLIRPLLSSEETRLCRFMERVGAVGCLIDSVIDLRADEKRGLLNFEPTLRCRMKLIWSALAAGSSIALAHPRLIGLFFEAIADDVRDRFTRIDCVAPPLVNPRTSEVTSVG
jgi:hypothetical protein